MEYTLNDENERIKLRSEIKNLWMMAYEFSNSLRHRNINIKEKRAFFKIEKQLWELYKLYYNDMLQSESNTTKGTTSI